MRLAFAVLLLAVCARAEDLEGARDNFDTVVRAYVAQRASDSGVWTLPQRGTGKALKLRFAKTERETVRPSSGGLWRGIADFVDKSGKKSYFAEVTVATGEGLWDVKSLKWKTADEAGDLRLAALKAARRGAERKPGPKGLLPDLILPDAGGHETALAECRAEKCVTIYVAPWCPYCRAATGALKALRDHLQGKGVPVRVIVGKDDPAKVRAYAAEFGPDALLDPDARMSNNGVPHIYASVDGGGITAEQAGASPNESPESVAANLGL